MRENLSQIWITRLETDNFIGFVDFLTTKNLLNTEQVEDALKFLGGTSGVTSDEFYISGYENIAWYLAETFSFDELRQFITEYSEIIEQDADVRYFFAQALMEKKSLGETERVELIQLMPRNYRPFLLRRFIGP